VSVLSIRRGAPGDLDRLLEIEEAAFETDRLSRRSFAHALTSASSACLVAEAKDRVVGYALVNFRKNSRKARLFSLARAEDAPRGCGRALLAAAEAAAHDRGCVSLRLEVRETNERAIALYEVAGFRCFGRHDEYYEDGAPALRFEKALATLPDRRV
jgi:[ribosomal protein S18]-alanine N-acetyltransferase